jgi:hypothetical protein
MSMNAKGNKLTAVVDQIEDAFQELKRVLKGIQFGPDTDRDMDLPASSGRRGIPGERVFALREATHIPVEAEDHPETEALHLGSRVSPLEADEIIKKVEKIQRDTEVMERLEKVERQNRRITLIGAMFLSLMTICLSVFAFLLVQTRSLDKGQIGAVSSAPLVQESSAPVAGQGHSAPAASPAVSPKNPELQATAKYVGSATSNKYHYSDCKWAKTIVPEKLVRFPSAEEAQAKGYIPCPVCKPPLKDDTGAPKSENN